MTLSARGQGLTLGIRLNPLNVQNAAAPPIANSSQGNGVTEANLTRLARWLSQQLAQSANGTNGINSAATGVTNAIFSTALPANGNGEVIRFRANGTPSSIKVDTSQASRTVLAKPNEKARDAIVTDFFQKHSSQLQIVDPVAEFQIRHREEDAIGTFHYRLQQKYHGIKVWGGEAAVHLATDGTVASMECAIIPTPNNIPTNAVLTLTGALESASEKYFAGTGKSFGKSELVIDGAINGRPRLAWKLTMASSLLDARRFLVDAINGEVISEVSLVEQGAVTGSGADSSGFTRTLKLWQSGPTYYMADTSKSMYAATSSPPTFSACKGTIVIADFAHSQDWAVADYVKSSAANSGWIPDAVGAAYGLSKVYDYYSSRLGRNSYDNQGNSLLGIVRYGTGLPNAFWTEQYQAMAYGDGYASALDICGHEVTHGVIYSIGDAGILDYHDQPGALNEAMADIFGECIEARTTGGNDWLIGSQLPSPLRNIANPHALTVAGRTYPATMSEFIQTTDPLLNSFQNRDNGGVHLNSTIIGHCFYLLAQGMSGAIGMTDAERVFYRALTLHLLKQSQFIDGRHACVVAAEELFGVASTQALKTAEAFDAVGIVDGPSSAPPGTIPAVQAPDSTLCLRWLNGSGYYLVRRETAKGDSGTGSFVGTVHYLDAKRVSVSGDGSGVVFVTADHDIGVVPTDGTGPSLAGNPGAYHSTAISPDGTRAAVVLRDTLTGNPQNQIVILNLSAGGSQAFTLYGVTSEGNYLDIVDHADVMDFTADGRYLIYDAYCASVTANGDILDGWTIFAMDTTTGAIQTLLDLNTDLDIGNPALGNTHGNLIALDVRDKLTGDSIVISADLATGAYGAIGGTRGWGVPGYTGDDSAVIYSTYDATTPTTFSIYRRTVASDGITPVSAASLWLKDADYAVAYRRGTYYPSDAKPQVTLTFPADGEVFSSPTNIIIQANATDTDGTVSKVEFYVDSTLLGTATIAPFRMTWPNPAVGSHRITARAIDNLGEAADTINALVFVLVPPRITSQPQNRTVTAGTDILFSITATGTSPLSYLWYKDGAALSNATNSSYSIPSAQASDAGNYSVTVTNLAGTVVSSTAALVINTKPSILTQPAPQSVIAGADVTFTVVASGTAPLRYQWRKNAAAISGATKETIQLSNVQTNAAAAYSVVVTNNYGSITSAVANLTVTVSLPVLNVSVVATNLMLFWSTSWPGFTLQSTTNLSLPNSWSSALPPAVVAGANYVVTNTMSGGKRFYRLKR